MPDFSHLHVHSEYSLNDSMLRIGQIVSLASKQGMNSVALTDRNNLYAAIKFYTKARAAGIKPIIGCDLSVRDDSGAVHQLVLLAQNRQGFVQLCELISFAYQHDQAQGIVAVDEARLTLAQCSDLIALSGGVQGDIAAAIERGDLPAARARCVHWQRIFADRFYLQIARHGKDSEARYEQACRALGTELGVAAVASNLACFSKPEEYEVHEARVCISTGRLMDDPRRERFFTDQHYFKSTQTMHGAFADAPELLTNANSVAQRCNLELDLGKNVLPDFPLPDGQEIDTYLREQSHLGLDNRLVQLFPEESERQAATAQYKARLDTELDVVCSMGFPGYFLIVADFIQWAKDHDIPVGPGRGSGAGSLVAYALSITDLDPLAYDLLFERFLNPERVSMPDFDVDFCMDKRDAVIDYVAEKYGREKVSQIATHGTMAAKAVVRDVGRVLGLPYPFVDNISKLIPNVLGITLPDVLGLKPINPNEDAESKEKRLKMLSPDLIEQRAQNEDTDTLLTMALQLEGIARNVGKHAGGVVIAPTKITDFSALYAEQAGGNISSQFDKDDIEAAGLVKFDFLGLRTLTVIDWAVAFVNKKREQLGEQPLVMNNLPLDDPETYRLLNTCRTTAVFQLESRGMKDLIGKLRPDNFEEIIALVALYRPGPLKSGMVDDFVNRKHGLAEVDYPHPALEPILDTTYGVMVYQEQVMQVAQTLANYSLGEADILRRAMGKKKAEVMAEQREIFVSRAVESGVEELTATNIFDMMAKFAEYGFNKSHSAAYALLSYHTGWLKAHYPAQFMAAVLTSDIDHTDKIVQMIDECQAMGLRVLPPCINRSSYAFTVSEDDAVIYGLGAVKGVGEGAINLLINERQKNGPFSSLLDLCRRLDLKKLNKRTLETLICAGAFDFIEPNRGGLLAALPQAIRLAEQHHRDQKHQQNDMFGLFAAPGATNSQDTLSIRIEDAWEPREQLEYEKQTLGLFLSDHPVNSERDTLQKLCSHNLAELDEAMENWIKPTRRDEGIPIRIGGLVCEARHLVSKKGHPMAFITLDDRSGRREVGVFGDVLSQHKDQLSDDEILIIDAKAEFVSYRDEWRIAAQKIWRIEDAKIALIRHIRIDCDEEFGAWGLLPSFS
ncbi:DNA polymerase III subunit alpha [Suttonella sp. R2A3]|uniref:DNA polymerase III subunit alpha n=1 Tax=Suttonella sp. R2A3 TaxID=2908648 RepID=UPI001F1BDD9F|nr:DNA polymerase III subunit alpha [Suttonella sp. R2A3]UJF24828.1 DNA polymerase III subunit alpha [Suttonella sp. R2A3]